MHRSTSDVAIMVVVGGYNTELEAPLLLVAGSEWCNGVKGLTIGCTAQRNDLKIMAAWGPLASIACIPHPVFSYKGAARQASGEALWFALLTVFCIACRIFELLYILDDFNT